MSLSFPKVASSSKVNHQEALNICAADGASLPTLTSTEDANATRFFMNMEGFTYAWTSLIKIDNGTECDKNACDGLLQWPGGQTFTYNASIYMPRGRANSAVFPVSQDHDCFRMGHLGRLMALSCGIKTRVICQYTCLSKSPTMSNCRTEDKYTPLDTTMYAIKNAVTTKVPGVIHINDGNLLNSICSMMCSRKDSSPSCIGFSTDISISRGCTLYKEVEVVSNNITTTATQEIWLRQGI